MDFKQLVVWQKSMLLVREVYLVTQGLPKIEQFGLISQMRRAAISVPANIAEGRKRRSRSDFVQFLRIADGSAAELETLLLITRGLYSQIDVSQCLGLLEEIQRMLSVLIRKLGTKS